jgi:hypothetical protein
MRPSTAKRTTVGFVRPEKTTVSWNPAGTVAAVADDGVGCGPALGPSSAIAQTADTAMKTRLILIDPGGMTRPSTLILLPRLP